MKLIIGTGEGHLPEANRSLIMAIARARVWADCLISGEVQTVTQIAEAEGVSDGYIGQMLPLAFLAPEIVARILNGYPRVDLTATQIVLGGRLAALWKDQLTAAAIGKSPSTH